MNEPSAPTTAWQTPKLVRLGAAGTAGTGAIPYVDEAGHYISDPAFGTKTSVTSPFLGPLGAS